MNEIKIKEELIRQIEQYDKIMNFRLKKSYIAGQIKVYHDEMGLKIQQIAEKVGIPEESVFVLISRINNREYDF